MSLGGRGVLGAVAVVAFATSCTADSSADGAPEPVEPTSSRTTEAASREQVAPAQRCTTPASDLLDRAKAAIAPHPGPVRMSALVRAARTDTGTWHVIGIDRDHVLDDGTPTGSASRSLGLTNAVGTDFGASVIPIAEGTVRGELHLSWDNVSWSGETLRAGRRAARQAVACLDAAAR